MIIGDGNVLSRIQLLQFPTDLIHAFLIEMVQSDEQVGTDGMAMEEHAGTLFAFQTTAELGFLIDPTDGIIGMQGVAMLTHKDTFADDMITPMRGLLHLGDEALAHHHLLGIAVSRLNEVATGYHGDLHQAQVTVRDTILVGDVDVLLVITGQVNIIATMRLNGQGGA